jgi:transporter family protein
MRQAYSIVFGRNLTVSLMIFIFLTTLFWGAAAIFDKLALGKASPFTGMMVRQFILTAILFAVGMAGNRLGSLGTVDLRTAVLLGLSGICGGVLGLWSYYHALRLGGASLVVPITATYPLVTVLLSWLILQETLTVSRVLGTVLIVVGVWLVK